jgi:hypothetical protein
VTRAHITHSKHLTLITRNSPKYNEDFNYIKVILPGKLVKVKHIFRFNNNTFITSTESGFKIISTELYEENIL